MKLIRHVTNMLLAAFVCGTLGLVEFVGIPTQEVPTVGLIKNLEVKLLKKLLVAGVTDRQGPPGTPKRRTMLEGLSWRPMGVYSRIPEGKKLFPIKILR